jgi:hypothetical protein
MSLIKSISKQLGLSVTPANNFTLDASADNGTMKLARGNAGATTQDIMTVDASGKVAFPQQGQSLTTPGYIKLPGGLIIQWGVTPQITSGVDSGAPTYTAGAFPIPFPNSLFHISGSPVNPQATGQALTCAVDSPTLSQWSFGVSSSIAPAPVTINWLAIGY